VGSAVYSTGTADVANTSFTGVTITSPNTAINFVDDTAGGSSATIEAKFDTGTGNSEVAN
jgi:hypothetical protein